MAQSQKPTVESLDHLVLTVQDIDATIEFYETVLGMTVIKFDAADGSHRRALKFGLQKINLHRAGNEFDPKANTPLPGSGDLCFLSSSPISEWQKHLKTMDIPVEEGPVLRTGAMHSIMSLYIRDPDKNLIEIGCQP